MLKYGKVVALLLAFACYGENASARYIQSDPVGLEGGVNTYTYVRGKPISWIDPLGLVNVDPNSINGEAGGGPTNQIYYPPSTYYGPESDVSVIDILLHHPITQAAALAFPAARAAKMCYQAAKTVKDPCQNAILAAVLGAAICGQAAGTVQGSARSYPRDRERIEDITNATRRTPRRNTGTQPE